MGTRLASGEIDQRRRVDGTLRLLTWLLGFFHNKDTSFDVDFEVGRVTSTRWTVLMKPEIDLTAGDAGDDIDR